MLNASERSGKNMDSWRLIEPKICPQIWLIAVHIDEMYIAYDICEGKFNWFFQTELTLSLLTLFYLSTINNKEAGKYWKGMVRVVIPALGHKALIKGMTSKALDLQFAREKLYKRKHELDYFTTIKRKNWCYKVLDL